VISTAQGGIVTMARKFKGSASRCDQWSLPDTLQDETLKRPKLEKRFFVPFSRNRDFVGREDELEQLHQVLTCKGNSSASARSVGLTGVDGIGKTQLAIEYVYKHEKSYPGGVFWINATEFRHSSLARLGKCLCSDVADHPQEEQVREFVNYVRKQKSLLILDDLINPTILNQPKYRQMIPPDSSCRILFTTLCLDLDDFQSIQVTALPEGMTLKLLLHHHRHKPILNPSHPEHKKAQAICDILGRLPLALNIAGAHLGRRPNLKLEVYYQRLLQDRDLRTLKDLSDRQKAAVDAVLRNLWAALGNELQSLLRVAAQLPEGAIIPTARLGLLTGRAQSASLAPVLRELEQNALVEKLRDDQVWLHPLVRTFVAKQIGKQTSIFRQSCVSNLVYAYENIAVLEDQAINRCVDALRDDIAAGINLLSKAPKTSEDIEERLESLYALLDVHPAQRNQQEWEVSFLKQILDQAAKLRLDCLAAKIAERLTQLGKHCLLKQWYTTREPRILKHDLCGHRASTRAVAVTPDGRFAVSASNDSTLKVWDLRTGQNKQTLCGHKSGVRAVAVTRDGGWAISASNDRTLKVWDLKTGQPKCSRQVRGGGILAVALTPDEQWIVSALEDGTLKVWDRKTLSKKQPLNGHHERPVTAVVVTPDGRRIISASYDCKLKVWSLKTGLVERTLNSHRGCVSAVVVTQDGHQAISASLDHTLREWDLKTGESDLLEDHKVPVKDMAATPDGYRIVSAFEDGTLKVWNRKTGKKHTLCGHQKGVTAVAMTPDGRWVVSASRDHTLKVWDLQAVPFPRGHKDGVIAVASRPKLEWAVSASRDGVLKIWELQTGDELVKFELGIELQSVTLSPDGKEILAGDKHGNIHYLRYNAPIPNAA
jgi:WD40 repeat protein